MSNSDKHIKELILQGDRYAKDEVILNHSLNLFFLLENVLIGSRKI